MLRCFPDATLALTHLVVVPVDAVGVEEQDGPNGDEQRCRARCWHCSEEWREERRDAEKNAAEDRAEAYSLHRGQRTKLCTYYFLIFFQ